jgi:phage gp36-like protein
MSEAIWKPVLEADLQRTVMNPLLNAQRTAALAPGQADPLTGAIEDAVAEVRAAVETCLKNVLSTDKTTVPPSLRMTACWIALAYLAKRLTVLKLTADQTSEINEARAKLKEVAKCEFAVAKPSDPEATSETQRGGGVSVVCPNTDVRGASPSQMAGL